MTRAALIGTGRMGSAMARALTDAGIELVLHNRTPERAVELAHSLGPTATTAASPAEAAATADVVLLMLADDAAVDAVLDGPDGVLAGARPGTLVVDHSTVRPTTLRAHAGAAAARGIGLLDAPVSGSTTTAAGGQLTLMVGGEAADLERARPVLEPLARTIVHLGPLGTGAAMKLAVNTLIFGLNNALAEGLVLAEAAGVDRERAYDTIAASVVGSPFIAYKREAFLQPEDSPVAFALDLAEKDLTLITGLAAELGVPMPQATTNLALVRRASSGGRGGRDFASVAVELRGALAGPEPAPAAAAT